MYNVISLLTRQREEELERLRQAEIERLEREAEAAAIAEMEELDAQLKVQFSIYVGVLAAAGLVLFL